jgi:hypothetical protein
MFDSRLPIGRLDGPGVRLELNGTFKGFVD